MTIFIIFITILGVLFCAVGAIVAIVLKNIYIGLLVIITLTWVVPTIKTIWGK
jgi:hypothetical protein